MDNTNFNALLPQVINSLITDEWEAVEGYNSALATLQAEDSPRAQQVCEIFKDIINEEYVHIGQLESCLSLLENDPTEHIEDGSEEGFEQLELPEDEDDLEEPSKPVNELDIVDESKKTPEIDNMDIEEVKKRLKAVGFDGTDFMGKSDKQIRAMLKINRRARGDQALKTWKKEQNKVHERLNDCLTEEDMKKVICSMITKYDASEEETFDELQSQDPTISRETVHQLYQMCSGFEEKGLENGEPDFEASWQEMNELED